MTNTSILCRRRELLDVGATSGFDPLFADVAGEMAFWAEGPSFEGLGLVDGASVSTWPDEDQYDRNATQATAAAQPKLVASSAEFGGRPVVSGDTTDDNMATATFTELPQPNTIVAVAAMSSAGSTGDFICDGVTGSARHAIRGESALWGLYAGNWQNMGQTQTAFSTDTNPHIIIARFDGVASHIRLDGVQSADLNPGVQGLGGVRLFSYVDGTMRYGGRIAFWRLFSRNLTLEEAQGYESWAAAHYGLTVS